MKKQAYNAPRTTVVEVRIENLLNDASMIISNTTVGSGLSRRRNDWDDEDDEE